MSSTPNAPYSSLDSNTKPTTAATYEPQPLDVDGEQIVYGNCMTRSVKCVPIAEISAWARPGSFCCMLATQCALYGMAIGVAIAVVVILYSCIDRDADGTIKLLVIGIVILAVMIVISISWVLHLARLRRAVRERFQIDGTSGDDCCVMCCSLNGAVAQMARQTKARDLGACDMKVPDALPPYQA